MPASKPARPSSGRRRHRHRSLTCVRGGERRKAFLRYWWHDTLNDAPKWLSYHGLKLLPSAWASALGAFHYGIVCRFYPAAAVACRKTPPAFAPTSTLPRSCAPTGATRDG